MTATPQLFLVSNQFVADVASDATILGTAFGDFSTTAESTDADATANAAQTMRGIEDLNLNLWWQRNNQCNCK